MFNSVNIFADHKDLIHDVSYSHNGKRLATCSSDQSVKVWDLGANGQWICSSSWKTHCGSVWRVVWAHPEFGQILATCSFDRTVLIWEEVMSESDTVSARRGGRGTTHWLKRSTLVDSRSNVTDVKFAPRHLGLQLATVSQSGLLRVYEAVDVVNVSQWSLQDEVGVGARCSALSWSMSRSHPPLIAVSSDDPHAPGGKVHIFQLQDSTTSTKKKWGRVETLGTVTEAGYDVSFAPAIGRSFHLLAIASKQLHVFALKPIAQRNADAALLGQPKLHIREIAKLDPANSQVWRVSWNITGTVLASTGSDGCVKLWKGNHEGSWRCMGRMKPGESRLDMSPKGDGARYY